MKIFFSGHTSFGNRGCEALIRSTVGLLKSQVPDAQFVVPSTAIDLDRQQWPQAEGLGVEFVPAASFPSNIKWWNRAVRLLPALEKHWIPRFTLEGPLRAALLSSDAMIVSGGDVISLDYGLASLYDWTGHSENAISLNKPVAMFAGSVGPFTRKPYVERFIAQHMAQYSTISVRESSTLAYTKTLGLDAQLVADPAFTLAPEEFDTESVMPQGADGCLGFNVSPLIRGYRATEESRSALDTEITQFLHAVVSDTEIGVLLIPHVGPLDGSDNSNSDYHYLKTLMERASLDKQRVRLAPSNLNAAQLKHLISKCRYFMGARTHATIAAFSSYVPTTSIAYSVKAKGINQDLFGNLDYVLETPAVTKESLVFHLTKLRSNEDHICTFLAKRVPEIRAMSAAAAKHFVNGIQNVK